MYYAILKLLAAFRQPSLTHLLLLLPFTMEPTPQNASPLTPIAIVIGFGLIAAAIYFSGMGTTTPSVTVGNQQIATTESTIPAVTDKDYIRGNPNAPIMIVEYSDYDCPFCQVFHETMQQLMDEYALGGQVAWVYRQLPVVQLHPNAPKISEAALCVGKLAGNEGFWEFSDLVFNERGTNEPTNMTRLSDFATRAGAEKAAFDQCLQSGEMKDEVDASVAEGFGAGIQGTPHSVIMVGNQQAVIEGAQPYAAVRQIVENLIGQLEGTVPTDGSGS